MSSSAARTSRTARYAAASARAALARPARYAVAPRRHLAAAPRRVPQVRLEVKDEDVALTEESVAQRVERVKGMTNPKHVEIMTKAVEALGWCTDYDKVNGMAVFVQWQRALLKQGRKASVAYAAAIAEVEAVA